MNQALYLLVFAALAVIIFVPLGAIEAVNTLFNTDIPITFDTWMSSLLLCAIIYGSSGRKK